MKIKSILIVISLILLITGCSNQTIDVSEIEYGIETNVINVVEAVETTELEPLPPGTVVEIDFLFPYLIWGGKTYEILVEQEIGESKLGVELGEVERYVSTRFVVPSENSEKFKDSNGDSNLLRVGSKIYKIKWKKVENEIAVEYKGKYYKAKAKWIASELSY